MATAIAHPNIALVKYWGKRADPDNQPASPSLSITVAGLQTTTSVEPADADRVTLNGTTTDDAKIRRFLHDLRAAHPVGPVAIQTENDFPTGAGLASSAAGFAALITALDATFGLGMTRTERAEWARRGSGSAARSLFSGFVTFDPDAAVSLKTIAEPADWPLSVIVGITSTQAKPVSSTAGMERSRTTSPFYSSWIRGNRDDFDAARRAIEARDFAGLTTIAESSCLKMHAVMLSSAPSLVYWHAATVAAIHAIQDLRERGESVFFTIDAGPQIKAVCTPASAPIVRQTLAAVPGIQAVVEGRLGSGARTLPAQPS